MNPHMNRRLFQQRNGSVWRHISAKTQQGKYSDQGRLSLKLGEVVGLDAEIA